MTSTRDFASMLRKVVEAHEANFHASAGKHSKSLAETANELYPEWAVILYIILDTGYVDIWEWCDKVAPLCTCEYAGPGLPMNTAGCKVHTKATYPCDHKDGCTDYRPVEKPYKRSDGSIIWSRCACGHVAQEHN